MTVGAFVSTRHSSWNVTETRVGPNGLYYAVYRPLLMGPATPLLNPNAFTPESTYDMIRKSTKLQICGRTPTA